MQRQTWWAGGALVAWWHGQQHASQLISLPVEQSTAVNSRWRCMGIIAYPLGTCVLLQSGPVGQSPATALLTCAYLCLLLQTVQPLVVGGGCGRKWVFNNTHFPQQLKFGAPRLCCSTWHQDGQLPKFGADAAKVAVVSGACGGPLPRKLVQLSLKTLVCFVTAPYIVYAARLF